MRKEEVCKNCGRDYDGSYPCPKCGSVNFKAKDSVKSNNRKVN